MMKTVNVKLILLRSIEILTLWIYVYALWMLLALVFLYAKDLAVPILVLENMCILLTLQPRVLQIKKDRLVHSALQQSLHLLTVVFHSPSVEEGARRAGGLVLVRLPLLVWEVLEVVIHRGLIWLRKALCPFPLFLFSFLQYLTILNLRLNWLLIV